MYNVQIYDKYFIVSKSTNVYSYGYKIEFDDMKTGDCLKLMDKLKRIYFEKLKESE